MEKFVVCMSKRIVNGIYIEGRSGSVLFQKLPMNGGCCAHNERKFGDSKVREIEREGTVPEEVLQAGLNMAEKNLVSYFPDMKEIKIKSLEMNSSSPGVNASPNIA